MKVIKEPNLNWGMIILFALNAFYWVNVYYFGFIVPTIWTIVIACIIGLWLRLTGRR